MKSSASMQGEFPPSGLHFMDRPKWAATAEHLWVGHYLTFEVSETAALSGVPGYSGVHAGLLLLNQNTSVTIQDCKSGVILSDAGKNITLANRFLVSARGDVRSADHAALFSDGQLHIHFQIANTPMRAVFSQMPGFSALPPEIKRDSGGRTRGWFSSRIEARILAANAYDVTADVFESLKGEDLGKQFRIIDGHEAWGAAHFYFGAYSDGMPKSWNAMAAITYRIAVAFEWNNTGIPYWSFCCLPAAETGHTRATNAGIRWNAVDLVEHPRSWE
jgi:hypothetical protein